MSATADISISGSIDDLPSGSQTIGPLTIASTAANGSVTNVTLASGDNTIAVPASPACTGCLIVFDPTSTVVKKLKGAGADTGITLAKASVNLLTFDSPAPANIVINASAADTGKVTQILFF